MTRIQCSIPFERKPMALTESQQFLEAFKRAKRPVICIGAGSGVDGHAAALGLARILGKLGTRPDLLSADGVPGILSFLEGTTAVKATADNLRRFVIELDASKAKAKELTYELKGDKLQIHVTPSSGSFDPKDLTVSNSGFRYDLIVTVGAADLAACGTLFATSPDFFYATPIVNVDFRPENEQYGALNAVDLTASSCGEVCHDLCEAMDPSLMDEESATAFLTGMIARTKSFKRANVTPRTMQTAGKLVAKGARREAIVERLYRTRTVPTLRLWGRALARLKKHPDASLVWSSLSRQDFLHAGAEESVLEDVIDELITSSPDAKVTALLAEATDGSVHAYVHAERPYDALALCAAFSPTGSKEDARLSWKDGGIVKAEQDLTSKIAAQMKNRPV